MMRAILIKKFGNPSVLCVDDIEIPRVKPPDVLVKIKSAGVNPVDTYIRSGAFLNLPDLPFTPGKDAAGIVEAVGEAVTKVQVGQRVFICGRKLGRYGTYAEFSLVKEDDVFPLDTRLSFDQGAALGIPYFTAYRALVLKAECNAGETVLIHGASGAVGLAAVQLAKSKGLKVIGTAGTRDGMDLIQENGADWVVCHREKNYTQIIMDIAKERGIDIVIEMLANVNLSKDLEMLALKGRVAIVGSRGPVKIDPRSMMGPETQIVGVALLNSTEAEWRETSEMILNGIKTGWVKPVIDKRYDLEKAAEAHKYIMDSPGAKGKIILHVES